MMGHSIKQGRRLLVARLGEVGEPGRTSHSAVDPHGRSVTSLVKCGKLPGLHSWWNRRCRRLPAVQMELSSEYPKIRHLFSSPCLTHIEKLSAERLGGPKTSLNSFMTGPLPACERSTMTNRT